MLPSSVAGAYIYARIANNRNTAGSTMRGTIFLLMMAISLLLSGCSNKEKNEIKNNIKDFYAEIKVGTDIQTLKVIIRKIEKININYGDSFSGGEHDAIVRFVDVSNKVFTLWDDDFGCESSKAVYIDVERCDGGREGLVERLNDIGAEIPQSLIEARISFMEPVRQAVIHALTEEARAAEKAL